MVAFKASARQWVFAFGAGFLVPGWFSLSNYLDAFPSTPLVELEATLVAKKDRGRNFFTFVTPERSIRCNLERCHRLGLPERGGERFVIGVDGRGIVFSIRDGQRVLLTPEQSSRHTGRDGLSALGWLACGLGLMAGAVVHRLRFARSSAR